MTDAPSPLTFDTDHPSGTFSTIYADGVTSLAHSPHVVKFYLGRNEPSFSAGDAKAQAVAQVVMPIDGFVHTVLFFQRTMATLIQNNVITQAQIDAIVAGSVA